VSRDKDQRNMQKRKKEAKKVVASDELCAVQNFLYVELEKRKVRVRLGWFIEINL
jgi:hypothetical protein